MHKCLTAFGFGPTFHKWVKIMYTDVSSCVINNGFTSKYFSLKCGIRQGCPLSALLFIIAVETLSHAWKSNPANKGITLNSKVVTITQLADDTTLVLSDIRSLQISL